MSIQKCLTGCRVAFQARLGGAWQTLHGPAGLGLTMVLSSPRLPLRWMMAGA